jgi:nucleotide-binding universal stress UspA family protein
MFRMLVAMDFSDCSRLALNAALTVAARVAPAELVVLNVLERADAQDAGAFDQAEQQVTALREMVEAELTAMANGQLPSGVRVHYTVVRGSPADEVIAQAGVHRADVIVMGTHGRTGLDRLLAGSVAERVVRQAPCSVLTIKPKRT